MSAASHAAGSGVVIGLVAVLLAQQFGYIELSNFGPSITYLVVGAVVGGILFGLIGWLIGRRAQPTTATVGTPTA